MSRGSCVSRSATLGSCLCLPSVICRCSSRRCLRRRRLSSCSAAFRTLMRKHGCGRST
uniref:Uncharacterized protein n=1 Tax=Arundo donax TaxID=35708 RepID=A0A0A9EYR4_ARUDO